MDYTHIPEALLYKRKSVDKLAMLHPLNAIVFKRLMKMEIWNRNYSRENQVLPCINNAYYICTIMRLEYDATFREDSYKRIAREGYNEGEHRFKECVTLSLVVLLIAHSTPEWHQKLREVKDGLLQYVLRLFKGLPSYLSKDLDNSWVLPDELFKPRALDEKALYDLHRQDPSFNWDKYYYHHDEDDIREMVEKLGQTPQEKATLIRSFWKDIYYSRKELDGPIRDTWLFLKTLAQEFCPEYIEMTELHKIPETGIEFEKRISELEAEVKRLEQQLGNVDNEASSEQETQVEQQEAAESDGELNEGGKYPQFTNRQLVILFQTMLNVTLKAEKGETPVNIKAFSDFIGMVSGRSGGSIRTTVNKGINYDQNGVKKDVGLLVEKMKVFNDAISQRLIAQIEEESVVTTKK